MAAKTKKPFLPQMLTANTLADGEVVYLTANETWSLRIEDAAIYRDKAAAEKAEAAAAASMAQEEVIDVYLFVVEDSEGICNPASVRERIRALGPTVRRDLGKQAA